MMLQKGMKVDIGGGGDEWWNESACKRRRNVGSRILNHRGVVKL
jgi:hypothetical protein